jgi:MFS transporter, MHS family, shikimate and dehydroshikimate transport protein
MMATATGWPLIVHQEGLFFASFSPYCPRRHVLVAGTPFAIIGNRAASTATIAAGSNSSACLRALPARLGPPRPRFSRPPTLREGRRGFAGTFGQIGVPLGVILGNAAFLIVGASVSDADFAAWGWRIPFLASAILVGVGLFIRLRLMESPAFERVKETKTEAPRPIVDVIRKYPREVLVAMGMRVAENGAFYILTVFVLAYGEEELGLSEGTMLTGVIIAAAIGLVTVPLWGALSDRVGRRPLYLAGAVVTTLWAFPLFGLMNTETPILIWLSIVVGVNLGHDLMYGPQAAYFSELFGTRVRYSGASLGYQLASVFAGGLAPLIATALLAANGGNPTLVALYMMAMGLISVVATLYATETFQKDVHEDEDEERELVREHRFDRERLREPAETQ